MIPFLDFDGVLHPEPAFAKDALCRLHLVEEILRDFLSVEIVISSAWRLARPFCSADADEVVDCLGQRFSNDVAGRIVGVTPTHRELDRKNAPAGPDAYRREWECVTWLRTHRTAWTRWLALDDKDYLFKPFCPNLMVTSAQTGFMKHHEDEFRRRLKELGDQE